MVNQLPTTAESDNGFMAGGDTRVLGTNTFEELVDALTRRDLPALPIERRDETVGFSSRRLQQMAAPVRIGLQTSLVALAPAVRLFGPERVSGWLASTSLPFVGDISRAMRYLVVSYVWERWPATGPDGAPSLETGDQPPIGTGTVTVAGGAATAAGGVK